jgi:transposase
MKSKFKAYSQGQLLLLPPNLEELIEPGHLARIINDFTSQLDYGTISKAFPGGGCPSYDPLMMLKVLLYAFCTKTFSSREIEKHLKQDVVYMWLSGMQRPDHNTINRFRSVYLATVLDEVFFQLVGIVKEKGYLNLNDLFVDGTKIEANAGRYTYVWRKNVERYKENVQKKIALLLEEINQINAKEDQKYGENPSEELTIGSQFSPEEIKEIAEKTSSSLKKKQTDKEQASLLNKKNRELEENRQKLSRYQAQQDILNGRNSYSKTDNDASFMRTKDNDLRPCFNPIISTNNQYIVNVTVSQNAADNVGFIEHVNKLLTWNDGLLKPENIVGDAGFGNEENYQYLIDQYIGNFLKYNNYDCEQTSHPSNVFRAENMEYNADQDYYLCPSGKKLKFKGERVRKTATGFNTKIKDYECEDCCGCILASKCKKATGNKTFSKSINLEAYKHLARENLNSKKGLLLHKQRGPDVETPFADIKHNMGIRKFRLRGKSKVKNEMLWIAMAHNLRKVAKKRKSAA